MEGDFSYRSANLQCGIPGAATGPIKPVEFSGPWIGKRRVYEVCVRNAKDEFSRVKGINARLLSLKSAARSTFYLGKIVQLFIVPERFKYSIPKPRGRHQPHGSIEGTPYDGKSDWVSHAERLALTIKARLAMHRHTDAPRSFWGSRHASSLRSALGFRSMAHYYANAASDPPFRQRTKGAVL